MDSDTKWEVKAMFMGEFNHTIDPKNRVIVPAKFREGLGEKFVVSAGLDGCLYLMKNEDWESFAESLNELPINKESRQLVRFFMRNAQECEPDKQGSSLVLPSYYLVEEEGRHFVYAANAKNRIEKRTVTLGAYMEETDSYEIIDGLTYTDRIAFPDETVREGMTASETVYADETGMLGEEPMDFEAPIDMEEPFDAEQLDETEFGDGGWE